MDEIALPPPTKLSHEQLMIEADYVRQERIGMVIGASQKMSDLARGHFWGNHAVRTLVWTEKYGKAPPLPPVRDAAETDQTD